MKSPFVSLLTRAFILFTVVVFANCSAPPPSLNGMDVLKWKEDKLACNGARQGMQEALSEQKEKLKGLSESAIIKLLGRPDQNELYKRNQKFYSYFISPGQDCNQPRTAMKLTIRFNAMGRAKEVVIE